ncbi:MAG TPA: hypothetical protein DIS76_07415, partial [Rhodospirillaceae bacterium]|nr:hypothetical protein [Rhodospirillaceae bacterium]
GLMRQAKAFGWHLGKFDIRQDARIHRSLMNYFLPELANTSAEERSKLLNEKLKSCSHSDWQNMARIALDKIEAELDVAAETPQKTKLNVLKDTLLRLQRVVNQNPDHFDRYIISNCGQTSDALDLLALLRATGTADKQRMVFLRESHADLVALPEFIREICHNAEFTNYIAQHNNNIEIMVAMSDTQRQDGPTVLFAQRQGVVDSALVLLEINRTRKQQGLPPLTMTITAGGSDDIVRGGNDPSSFFFNISREVYAASRLQGYEPDEIAAILGPEILRTDQGRDVENDFGDPTNTKKKMEQHTAAAFNWQRFLVVQKDTWEQVGMPQQRKIENEILSLEGTLVEYRKAEAKEFAEIDDMDAQRFWPARIIEVEEKIKSLQQDLEPIKEKTKAFLEQEEKYIQPFKANRRAQKIVEDSCMWIYHSFRGEVLDSLSAGVIPANATRTLNTGARPIQRPGFNPEEHKDVATSGIDAALAALALPLTDTRAITNQFAVELSKLHLQGWLGLSGLKDVSEFELYDMYNESNCFQDTLLRAQMEMMKTNFDHVWSSWSQIHRAESPNPQEGENYADVFAKRIHQRHGVQLSQQDMADMMQELSLQDNLANRSKVILSWLQKEFIETDKIIGQAQFGCEEGAQISAAERFKLYPRQHAEMMAREQTNRFPSIWLARMHGDYYATHPLGEQGNWIQDRTFQLLSTMCVDTQRTPTTFLNLSPGPKERHMEYRKRELHEEFHFKTIGVHFRDCVSKEPTTPRAVHYTSLAHHQTAILALRP